jgi:hypothetical protein
MNEEYWYLYQKAITKHRYLRISNLKGVLKPIILILSVPNLILIFKIIRRRGREAAKV